MNEELFSELLASVREGGAILRGEKPPSRRFVVPVPNVKQIRERYALSQSEFADLLGVSIKTLQNWEQGRRAPHGAARSGRPTRAGTHPVPGRLGAGHVRSCPGGG